MSVTHNTNRVIKEIVGNRYEEVFRATGDMIWQHPTERNIAIPLQSGSIGFACVLPQKSSGPYMILFDITEKKVYSISAEYLISSARFSQTILSNLFHTVRVRSTEDYMKTAGQANKEEPNPVLPVSGACRGLRAIRRIMGLI